MKNIQPEGYPDLEEMLKGISDAFVYLDQSWHYRFINDNALLLLNKSRDELLGKTIWNAFPDIVGTVFEENYRKVMEERIHIAFAAYSPVSRMWIEVRAYPHGQGISIFFSDVTQKKKAFEIIEESEKWFHNVADKSPVMIWSANTDMFYNYVNDTWLHFTGRGPDQVLGNGWSNDIFDEDKERVIDMYQNAFKREVSFRTEYRLQYRDGTYRWVSHAGKPLYAPDKNFLGYTGTCIDVDEQVMVYRQLEKKVSERTAELTAALEREKELNSLKSRFVSIASHEFRTPLSAMLSSVELMEQYQKIDEPAQVLKHMNRIKGSVKHMINILNDFLSLDKLEQGAVIMEPQVFNLEEFILETVEELYSTLKVDQHILCNYDGLKEVNTDKNILHNILMNLLSNAIKYSESDIDLQVDVNNLQVNISVTDHGIGIPEKDQQLMFRKYFRASNVGNIKGTGLGLNIVQRYVELLNGKISFKSEYGKGTTFNVQFSH